MGNVVTLPPRPAGLFPALCEARKARGIRIYPPPLPLLFLPTVKTTLPYRTHSAAANSPPDAPVRMFGFSASVGRGLAAFDHLRPVFDTVSCRASPPRCNRPPVPACLPASYLPFLPVQPIGQLLNIHFQSAVCSSSFNQTLMIMLSAVGCVNS